MHTADFLSQFLLVLVVSTLVAFVFDRLRLPTILGFLLSGVLIGPHGFGLLNNPEHIGQLADMGVILLMLTIGMEFSFQRLRGLTRLAIAGGTLQIVLSVAVGIAFAAWRQWTLYEGFLAGSVIALSSTAIVFKYLIDRGELATHHGRIAVSILIFQDLAVAPLMILITGLGSSPAFLARDLTAAFLKSAVLVAGAAGFSRYVLPHLLRRMASSRNREVFFLTAVAISLGAAWVSGQLGLSLALGAFFAGFMFANTDFSDMLIGEILPFRHVFVSVFFVSIGLLFDVRFALDNAGLLAMSVGLVLLVNFVLMAVIIVGFGFPPRVALAAGLILSQIGEFSFLLLEAAKRHGIGAEIYNVFLSTAFLTMLATPMLFALVPLIFKLTEMIPVLGLHPSRKLPVAEEPPSSAHVIVCGFGPAGRDLAATFMEENIPFVVLEMNARQVHLARRLGVRVIYGDAANAEVMRRAAVSRASAVIVSFADPLDLEQIVKLVQRLNPKTTVAVRTRYEQDMPRLYELGADIVVTEEWEASQELNRVILHHFDVGHDRIVHHLERIRARKELAIEEAILSRRPSDELKQKLKTGG